MKNSISIITYLRDQKLKLARFLKTLEEQEFNGELIVVVIGGEDPYELLEAPRDFSVKVLYMETKKTKKTIEDAKRIALAVAQTPRACFMPVGTLPTKKNILATLNKKGGGKALRPRYL